MINKPMHRTLNVNPSETDLFTSWSGKLSKPTCPRNASVRIFACCCCVTPCAHWQYDAHWTLHNIPVGKAYQLTYFKWRGVQVDVRHSSPDIISLQVIIWSKIQYCAISSKCCEMRSLNDLERYEDWPPPAYRHDTTNNAHNVTTVKICL